MDRSQNLCLLVVVLFGIAMFIEYFLFILVALRKYYFCSL